jgi:hypothetical protein
MAAPKLYCSIAPATASCRQLPAPNTYSLYHRSLLDLPHNPQHLKLSLKPLQAAAAAADQPADEPAKGLALPRVWDIFQVVKDPACNR